MPKVETAAEVSFEMAQQNFCCEPYRIKLICPKKDDDLMVEMEYDSKLYITPDSPWENAYIESFHDKLRDECLNRELLGSLSAARIIIEQWRVKYNGLRPHSVLGYQRPDKFAARHDASRLRSGSALPLSRSVETNNNIKPMAGLQF
jgi:hypothetical protein